MTFNRFWAARKNIGSRPLAVDPADGPPVRAGGWVESVSRRVAAGIETVGLDIGVALLAIAFLWGSLISTVMLQREAAYHEAFRDNRTRALAFEENIIRTIGGIDQMLQFLQSVYRRNPGKTDIGQWIRPEQLSDRLIVRIEIIDRSGVLVSNDPGDVADGQDFSDRDYFKAQRDSQSDDVFIGLPVMEDATRTWIVHLSRRLTGADGAFAGVAVVSLDPRALSRLQESLETDGESMSLVGLDGVVRARAPSDVAAIGESIKSGNLFSAIARSDYGDFIGKSSFDSIEKVYTYRVIRKYKIVVVAATEVDQIFAILQAVGAHIMVGLIVTALIVCISFVIIRRKLQLIQSKQAIVDLLNHISQGIIMVDQNGGIPVISRSVTQLLGLPLDFLSGPQRFDDLVKWQLDHGEFGAGTDAPGKFRSFIETSGVAGLAVYERTRPDGRVIEVRTNLLPRGGAVRTYTDVTERKRSEARIMFLAEHDPLTGLANRTTFQQAVDDEIASGHAGDHHFAVLFIDLDRFKVINDLQGHATGDLVLRHVADRLRVIVRSTDIVARLGGDEFAILQKNVHQPEAAMQLATRIVARLKEPFIIEGKILSVGVSVGVAPYEAIGQTSERLMKEADLAHYYAKERGRSQACLFDPSMDVEHEQDLLLEADLRTALSSRQFVVHYQPIMDVRNDRLVGFEALLRWVHPRLGVISPAVFIPIAERIGVISEIGEWIMRTASIDALLWPEHVRLSVNVSPVQFRNDNFPELVLQLVSKAGLAPERLTLEITETVLIEDGERVSEMIDRLRAHGFRLALDDFGAGHSSLSYVRRFSFDSIKIDRSFVEGIERDRITFAIVNNLLKLGHDLNIEVIAEGVETGGQLKILKGLDCRFIQGYYFSRPLPIDESLKLITPETPRQVEVR